MQVLKDTLHFLWKLLPGRLQWFLIWLLSPKFQIGISGVFFNDQGEVLLLKHVFRRKIVWELPGGILKNGESIEECMEREVLEETGFPCNVLGILKINSGFKRRLGIIVYGKINTSEPHKLSSEIYDLLLAEVNKLPEDLYEEHRKYVMEAKI